MKNPFIILAAAALLVAAPKPEPIAINLSQSQWENVKHAVDTCGTYTFRAENVVLTVTNSVPVVELYRSPGTTSRKVDRKARHPSGYQNQTTH